MAALGERIERIEAELRYLERELAEVRRLAAAESPEPMKLPPMPAPQPARPAPPAQPYDWSALMGARSLAWAGGGVTVLGIVFFFVLAIERGWIGHDARIALGAFASALAFGAGVWLRRRFGDTYAAVSAAGAGLAGGFATLVAASALYHLMPDVLALAIAGGIAAVAVWLARAWWSETVAGLGLVGAMLASLPIAWQHDGVSGLGVGFVGIALAAAALVVVDRDWQWLGVTSVVVAGAQAVSLVFEHHESGVPLALAFAAITLAMSIGLTLRYELDYFRASVALLSALLAGGSLAIAYGGRTEGWALLALVGAYLAIGALLVRKARNLAATLVAIALAISAIAAADLVSLFSLTAVWSVETVLLAWLATRVDRRFSYSSSLFLVLAIAHALATEAKPRDLLIASHDPARGVPALLLCIVAAAIAAWLLAEARDAATGVAAALGLYALSLLVLQVFEHTGADVHTQFQRGHTAVSALWAIVGASTLYAGLRLAKRRLQLAGFALFGLALVKLFVYDLAFLSSVARAFSFLAVGAMLLAAGFTYQRFTSTRA